MIIDEKRIFSALENGKKVDNNYLFKTIEKARNAEGLTLDEAAALLQCEHRGLLENMFEAANEVKRRIYGNRVVLFAPLYISNECDNSCLYCGFRRENQELERITLTQEQIRRETEILAKQGQKRILLVASEKHGLDYIEKAIETIYSVNDATDEIRRINVNIAPLSLEDFKRLKNCGIGTYQLFQETYHRETYAKMHPNGPKANYNWRLTAIDRAQEAGIDDVGIGVLFGLYDFKFEVLALLAHARYLDRKFKVGPHTISVPRIEPALNAPAANNPPHPVSDEDFKKIVAVLRLAVPYTGMILSTRETPEMRKQALELGISQISAGSRTSPGGYANDNGRCKSQFELEDTRPLLEVVDWLIDLGCGPSFCTACYRLGRTGERFMGLAKPGDIHRFCTPNSVLSLEEFLLNHGDQRLQTKGRFMITGEVIKIQDPRLRQKVFEELKNIGKGEKDRYI
ncbi:[FeFe] hydrogenase H-cluster radical SAM maturase HydG [Candidatus Woesearchaeota archaeon]|nr:[FeFe] hydrogenase H-cluster radical SAM maturase HydG [Candidatus Woesearchaeota archaeon]MBW3018046.1 [FeFe] hydrogenase H-cluster radical SAM maturase HydG [Candidatus Woesearchaeota archaeon]